MFPSTKPIIDYDDDDEPIYGSAVYTHSVVYNFLVREDGKRVLRIGCKSEKNEDFAKFSGDVLRFWVRATEYAKPQTDVFTLDRVKLITKTEIGYVPNVEMKGCTVTASATAPLNVSSAKWSTCILPFATEIPSGVTAYTVSNSDAECLYLAEAASIEAYTPYILNAEGGYSGNVSGTVDPAGYPEDGVVTVYGLNGAITMQEVTTGYVLQNGTEGVLFYPIGDGDSFTINPGKCWLSPDASGSKGLSFNIIDPSAVNSVSVTNEDNALYTLDGKKVVRPVSGQIYVKNGMKVLKK